MPNENNERLNKLLGRQGSIAERHRLARELDDDELQRAAPFSAEAKEELERRRHEQLVDSQRTVPAERENGSSTELIDPLAELAFGPLGDLDAVTGLRTRSAFDVDSPTFAKTCEAVGVPLACLIIDVDNFKRVNDTHGHQQGDSVLRVIASCASTAIRGKGRAYRYGGDEFVLLLLNFTAEDARGVGERIRLAVARLSLSRIEVKIGVTIGVASTSSGTYTAAELFEHADEVLLAAKNAGKGQVAVFGPEPNAAVEAVPDLATDEEIQRLGEWLESDNVDVRRDAAEELANLSASKRLFPLEAARPFPRQLLKDPDSQVRMLGLQTVAAIASKEGEQATGYYHRPLIEVVEKDADLDVRARAIAVIGHSGDLRFLEQICDWIANWEQTSYTRVNPIAGLVGLVQRHRAQTIDGLRRRADAAGTDQQRARFAEALREVRSVA